jgi:hypothetical protein
MMDAEGKNGEKPTFAGISFEQLRLARGYSYST